jgi:putative hydrolase of the HAD superfamily
MKPCVPFQEVMMALEQPQSIRAVFFDAGFTLVQPYPSTPEICQRVCKQLDLHLDLDALTERMTDAEDYYFRRVRLDRQTWSSEQTIAEFWIDYYMNLLRPLMKERDEPRLYQLAAAIREEFDKHTSWQLYSDVLPTLEVLRKSGQYTLGVISDWGIALGPILRRLHLTPYFDFLVVSAVTRHQRPADRTVAAGRAGHRGDADRHDAGLLLQGGARADAPRLPPGRPHQQEQVCPAARRGHHV